jgi:hypothetical protein
MVKGLKGVKLMKKIALMVLFLVLALGLVECRHHSDHRFDYQSGYGSR